MEKNMEKQELKEIKGGTTEKDAYSEERIVRCEFCGGEFPESRYRTHFCDAELI